MNEKIEFGAIAIMALFIVGSVCLLIGYETGYESGREGQRLLHAQLECDGGDVIRTESHFPSYICIK